MEKKVQKLAKRILCLLLAFCVGSSAFAVYAVSQQTQEQIDQMREEQKEAEEQKNALEKEQNKIHNQKAETEQYLKNLNAQSKSLNEQIVILNDDITEKEAEIEAKLLEIEEAQKELDKQYQDMKRRIQYMYESSQSTVLTYITAALTSGISDMLNQIEYATNINNYDRNMLESYKAAKASLEEQHAALLDEQEALELLKQETEKKKQQVASQQKAAGSKLSQFDELLDGLEGQLLSAGELIAEKTRLLNELIAKAEEEERWAKIQAAQNAASSMNGVTIIAGDAKISRHHITLSDEEMLWLAVMIYCEAGNQGYEGQIAVGNVIMNRVRSAKYPNSLKSVLTAAKQFEPYGSGKFNLILRAEEDDDIPNKVTSSCWQAARDCVNKAVDNASNVGDSLFFRTWAPVPQLITNLENGGVPYWIIKDHIFYYYWTSYSNKPSTQPEEDEGEEEEKKDEEDEKEEEEKPEETPKEPETPSQPEQGSGTTQKPETPSQPEQGSGTTQKPETPSQPEPETPQQPETPSQTESEPQPSDSGNGSGNASGADALSEAGEVPQEPSS